MSEIDTTPRIVFIDVDGTILEHGSVIAPSTVTAIRSARRAGHTVYLCTGRSAGDIHPAVREIGFDGVISNGGAFAVRIDDDGTEQPIAAHLMPRALTDRMLGYFDDRGIHYFLQTDDAVYASPGIGAAADEFFRQRRDRHAEDLRALGLDDDDAPLPAISYRPLDEVDLDQVVKATFISADSDTLARAQADLGDAFHVIPGSIPMPGGSNGEIAQLASTRDRRSSRCSTRWAWMPRIRSASATAGTTSRCSTSSAPPSRWAAPTPNCMLGPTSSRPACSTTACTAPSCASAWSDPAPRLSSPPLPASRYLLAEPLRFGRPFRSGSAET